MAWDEAPEAGEAEFWDPKIDEVLQGEVTARKKGKFDTFIYIEDDDGQEWKTPQHAQLARKIRRMKIEEGDIVRITYLGEKAPKGDNKNMSPTKQYKLEVWSDDDEEDEEDE